ncbi:HAMP domain-containing protein [candidate division KSB1 bacterium]|nr:HAMP domain-containing protein [candidate division KSB1 bacterium]
MIQRRLILFFFLNTLVVLLLAGFYLQYRVSEHLERQLGDKLKGIATAVAVQTDAQLVALLTPGDVQTRTYQLLKVRLERIKEQTGMQRLLILSPSGEIWLDTQTDAIGEPYARYQFDQYEIEQALSGSPASSVLFSDEQKRLFKSAYAPLRKNSIQGVAVVQGSAASLDAVRDIQATIFKIGLAGLFFSIILAMIVSRPITRPILELQKAARRIGKGRWDRPVPSQKGPREIVFLAHTMDEMRRELLARDEQQKAMLAGIAHEIRNPLGGIELYAGILNDEISDVDIQKNVDKILKESQNLKILIDQFIDYARPLKPQQEQTSVKKIWLDVAMMIEPECEKFGIRLEIWDDVTILMDPQHLRQVFLNLALNSIQAMAEPADQQKIISIEVISHDPVKIEFKDTGPGIPESIRERIFEPFFTQKASGMGLGLTMVKKLMEANKASIFLSSSGNTGTCFILNFPSQR